MAMTPTKAEIRSGEAILEELAVLSSKVQQSVAILESSLNACGTLPKDVQDAFATTKANSQALADLAGEPEHDSKVVPSGSHYDNERLWS